jgi:hypothetical protein
VVTVTAFALETVETVESAGEGFLFTGAKAAV